MKIAQRQRLADFYSPSGTGVRVKDDMSDHRHWRG
jgi:hypothetical protein